MSNLRIVITGLPGTGKTTIIKEIAGFLRQQNVRTAGFYTEEIRRKGTRAGFRVVDVTTLDSFILASKDLDSKVRVGKYGVNIKEFERYLSELESRIDRFSMVIIDEFGPMEFKSEKFRKLVHKLINSEKSWIVTTHFRAKNSTIPLIEKLSEVYTVTESNREELLHHLIKLLQKHLARERRSQENS